MKSYFLAKILYKLRISSFKKCIVDRTSRIDAQCVLAYVRIGRYSYVASETHITSTTIGNFVSIGGGCHIGGGKHPLNMVSTSPVFLKGRNILHKNFSNIEYKDDSCVVIGNDVWVGDGCYIKAGVEIGDGAIIGAHAVVTKNVDPFAIVAGCPAKKIKDRFPSEISNKLNEIAWWEWPDEKIQKYSEYFDDPMRLVNVLQGVENEDRLR